jgi:hypothetical protein
MEDAFLFRLLIGKEGRGGAKLRKEPSQKGDSNPTGQARSDAQSSSFLAWLEGAVPDLDLEKSSAVEQCKTLGIRALRAFFEASGATSEQLKKSDQEQLLGQVFDLEKCVAYVQHREALTSPAASKDQRDRFQACEDFKL